MNIPTIQEIRAKGFKTEINHLRYYTKFNSKTRKLEKYLLLRYEAEKILPKDDLIHGILPKGGVTEVNLTDKNGDIIIGRTIVSKRDTYNKKRGVRVALGRALQQLNRKF